jgi:DNA polymerase III epsilon subunit-like protein
MIILDVETTGLNPDTASIVSIGAIDFENPDDRFYEECRAWTGAEISDRALEVNGFSRNSVMDPTKQTEAQAAGKFLTWANTKSDKIIAGQNVHFDRGFINAALARAGQSSYFAQRIFDQHSVVMYHHMLLGKTPPISKRRESALNSDEIMAYVGLPPEPKPHIASNGALWEYEALYRLIYNRPSLPEFQQYSIPYLEEASV